VTGIIGNGSGVIALAQNGAGNLTLSGANTFSGGTSLTSGTITLGSSSIVTGGNLVSGPVGTGTFHIGSGPNPVTLQTANSSGTTRSIENNISLDGDIIFASTQTTGRIALNTLYSGSGASASLLTTPNTIVLTRTNQLTVNGSITVDLIGAVSGPGFGITKLGAGILNIGSTATTASNFDSNPNTFNGLTTVSAGTVVLTKTAGTDAIAGNLLVDGSGTVIWNHSNQINLSSNVTLAGGTVSLNGQSEGAASTPGLGSLTLNSTSTIDFAVGTFSSVIEFNSVGAHTSGVLQITNWNGIAFTGNGSERLLFNGVFADFVAAYPNQNDVTFNGTPGYVPIQFGDYYEITAIPEPSTWIGAALTLAAIGYTQRRRFAKRFLL
jgi:autotransporter-associated beta strand protein